MPVYLGLTLSHNPMTVFHQIKDCEFRAELTLTSKEAGLPLWTQAAYLAKLCLYSKPGMSSLVVSLNPASVEKVIMSKFQSVTVHFKFCDSDHETPS